MSDNEHQHADPFDQASALEEAATRQAINDVQRRCKRDQEPNAAGEYEVTECDDCGNDIGQGRLAVAIKNRLCIYCATARERKGRK